MLLPPDAPPRVERAYSINDDFELVFVPIYHDIRRALNEITTPASHGGGVVASSDVNPGIEGTRRYRRIGGILPLDLYVHISR